VRAGAVVTGLVLSLVACSTPTDTADRAGAPGSDASVQPTPSVGASSPSAAVSTTVTPSAPGGPSESPADDASYRVADPGHLAPPLLTSDLLVTSSSTIPPAVRKRAAAVRGVRAVLPVSLAALSANGRTLTVVAADPGKFRRFTPFATAQSDEVWSRVAGGEVAVDPSLPRKLEERKGYLRLGSANDSPEVHIGAYAPMVKQISAVVNDKRGAQLGLPRDNALLVSTGDLTPSAVKGRLGKVLGPGTTMQTLALEFVDQVQTAVLSGTSVSSAVGTFTYTPHADGTVTPERRWVSEYIRRENVPILGTVTCNKGMLPQLRAALTDVVQAGLADKIHAGEYAGCYYPRFIARDPAKGLSMHSWGIAVDLNVPGNQRGTVGEMDRRVVAIFKKWGFAWGGDWNYTDPMHFEMAKVVQVG